MAETMTARRWEAYWGYPQDCRVAAPDVIEP
jgi:hypothetical protein